MCQGFPLPSFLPSCYIFRVTRRKRKRGHEGRGGMQKEKEGTENTSDV